MKWALFLVLAMAAWADYADDQKLIQLAKKNPADRAVAADIRKRFDTKRLTDGGAAVSYLGEFVLAVESDTAPELWIDEKRAPQQPKKSSDPKLWIATATLKTGMSHGILYKVNGKQVGQRRDYPAYTELSYPKPGVAQGTMSEKITITSKLYPGMEVNFWYYVSPGVDPSVPAPVMLWQDGENLSPATSGFRLPVVTENLVAQKKLPPMVHVLVQPGTIGQRRMRAIEYDTLSDLYSRFILEEVFPIVEQKVKLRQDGYSRAIGGQSSGGICSFTAAWFNNDNFTRVVSFIGSYTSIQWMAEQPNAPINGGNLYPFLIRKTRQKKNIRIWISDGYEDLENEHGSWPLQNIAMANSLKRMGYDFAFRFGTAAHNSAHQQAELPEALAWVWRGYDPAKTSETFQQDPAEKDRPYFRVMQLNRE